MIATSASTRRTGNTAENFAKAGIVDAHAYSLLAAYELDLGGGRSEQLLKLRNPLYDLSDEWKG